MRLSEIFAGEKQAAETAEKKQNSAVQNTLINRQIRSLTPGQTIQGELVARNGSEVQIKLSEDLTIKARLEQNMNLEVGKNIIFEVKNNGQSLILNPLYTNVATDANVLKALDMAALPVNQSTIEMTEALMKAGLSIDKASLQQVFREYNQFAGADPASLADLIDLHKLSLPVTEGSLAQIASYKNLTHQLAAGLNDCVGALPHTIQHMLQAGDTMGAEKLYQELLSMIRGLSGGAEGEALTAGDLAAVTGQKPALIQTADGQLLVLELPGESAGQLFPFPADGKLLEALLRPENGLLLQALAQEGEVGLLRELAQRGDSKLLQILAQGGDSGRFPGLVRDGEGRFIQAFSDPAMGEALGGAVSMSNDQLLQTLLPGMDSKALQGLLESGDVRLLQLLTQASPGESAKLLTPLSDYLKDILLRQWTLKPEEVGEAKQVEQLYSRLDRQLRSLAQVLEGLHQTGSEAYRATASLTQNLDFLQQLNQVYTYVQLPLRLQQGNFAHGELFVYTNKKHLAAKDGEISALLHLDMEHLGPVDVYVTMAYEKLNTKFYVQDDEMLDFLEAHMDLLTKRLQARGYDCSCETVIREPEQGQKKSAIRQMLSENGNVPMVQYAFDVRT